MDDTVIERTSPKLRSYLVEVRYREPGYEARHGERRAPYRFRYRIEAVDEAGAIDRALAEFHEIASLSGVGWARDVVGCEALPVIGAAVDGR